MWLGLVLAIGVGSVLANQTRSGAPASASFLLLIFLFLFQALTLPEYQQQSASGFPSYLFLLPMGNLELVMWPMLLSGIFMAMSGAAIAVLILGKVATLSETWWIAPYLSGNVCMFQAVTWVPLKRPELRVLFSFATVASIISGPIAFGLGVLRPPFAAIVYGALMIGSIAISVRGVGRSRHGLATVGAEDGDKYRIPEVPAFRSRVLTLQWLVQKRDGLVMKVLTGMFIVLFGLVALVLVPTDPQFAQVGKVGISQSALGAICLTLLLPPYFGFGGCCGSEKDNIAKDRSVVPFLALRPLTTLQIVEAKVRMACIETLRMAVLCVLVALIILLLPTSTNGRYEPTLIALVHILSAKQAIGLLVIYVLAILGGVKTSISGIWLNLGQLPLWGMFVVTILPIMIVMGMVVGLVTHPDEIPLAVQYLPKVIYVLAGLKLVSLVYATGLLRKLRLVSDSLILKWFAGCAVAGVLIFAFACWAIPAGSYSHWAIAAQVFTFLPLVRVALAPVFVHRGRHG